MLFPRHAARDEYSEMADGFMDRVNDGLACLMMSSTSS